MFRLIVDDVFSIRGRGTVVVGQVQEGSVRVGDRVRIDEGPPIEVDGIESMRKLIKQADAGMNVGLLFQRLERSQVGSGDVITDVGSEPDVAAPAEERRDPRSADAETGAGTGEQHGRDPRFAEVEEQRAQFLSMRSAGLMDDAQIDESLRALAFSAGGRQWELRADSDHWYSSQDGRDWRRDTPPAVG